MSGQVLRSLIDIKFYMGLQWPVWFNLNSLYISRSKSKDVCKALSLFLLLPHPLELSTYRNRGSKLLWYFLKSKYHQFFFFCIYRYYNFYLTIKGDPVSVCRHPVLVQPLSHLLYSLAHVFHVPNPFSSLSTCMDVTHIFRSMAKRRSLLSLVLLPNNKTNRRQRSLRFLGQIFKPNLIPSRSYRLQL